MILDFDSRGNLHPGVHRLTWLEFKQNYGYNNTRPKLLGGLLRLARNLKIAGCRTIFVNGSFVTNKQHPGDYDACWDATGVDATKVSPLLLDFSERGPALSKLEFGGDIRPDMVTVHDCVMPFLEFFQRDKEGHRKGIVSIRLQEDNLE